MKNQASFSSKDKSKKKLKCGLLQFLFGAFRVKKVSLLINNFELDMLIQELKKQQNLHCLLVFHLLGCVGVKVEEGTRLLPSQASLTSSSSLY